MRLSILIISFFMNAYLSWHPTGHFITARIAERELTRLNKPLLDKLTELLLFTKGYTGKEKDHPFVECACYPDDIKYIGWKSFNKFHFYDNFIKGEGTSPEQMKKLGKSIVNMASAIGEARESLKNIKISMSDDRYAKSFSLRYLIHLVGDAHQPMHSGSRIINGKSDGGGNSLTLASPFLNLHAYWDKTLGVFKSIDAPFAEKQWIQLNQYCDTLISKFPRSALEENLKKKNTGMWIAESFSLEKEYAYTGIVQDKAIPQEYLDRARPIVEKQLALGGYRLADMIIDTFKDMDLNKVFANHVKASASGSSSSDEEEDDASEVAIIGTDESNTEDSEEKTNKKANKKTPPKKETDTKIADVKVKIEDKENKKPAPANKKKPVKDEVVEINAKVDPKKNKILAPKKKQAPKTKVKLNESEYEPEDDDESSEYDKQLSEEGDNQEIEKENEEQVGFFGGIGRFFGNLWKWIFG